MQLFITDFKKNGEGIVIESKEITNQMRKVLRMKPGDIFFVQIANKNANDEISRYQVRLDEFGQDNVFGNITKTENQKTSKNKETIIAIAMPNKRSKAELITQKLSELGINKIYFRPSQRSVIKQSNDKKISRLIKIAQEATEQSRGRNIPNIKFIKDISKITQNQDTKTIIFDKSNPEINMSSLSSSNEFGSIAEETKDLEKQNTLGIIGPEGGLTPNDYEKFGNHFTIQQLGDTILRTETASIIAGWEIKKLD